MFLKYTTREGNFNFARPSEVSYSCHIAVCDDDANKIKTCNFEPTFDLNGSDVDEIDYELEESMGRYWSTSDDRKEMLEFLRANKAEIEAGNIRRRLAEIETEISALEEEKTWSTSDDRKEMLEFLRANKAEIEAGNIRRRLAEIETEISALEEEKTRLTTTKKGQ